METIRQKGILGERPEQSNFQKISMYERIKDDIYIAEYNVYNTNPSYKILIKRVPYSNINDFAIKFNYFNDIVYDVPLFISYDFTKILKGINKSPSEILGHTYYHHIEKFIKDNYGTGSDAYRSIIFSIFISPIILEIGNLTKILENDYILVTEGGIVLRYFLKKYYTRDLDVKLYPINKNTYNLNKTTNLIKNMMDNIVKKLNKYMIRIVENHRNFINFLIKNNYLTDKDIIKKYDDIMKNISSETKFEFVKSRDNLYKLIFKYNDSFTIKLMDFNFYDNNDNLNNDIMKKLEKVENHIPLLQKIDYTLNVKTDEINYNTYYYINIPTLEYIKMEKSILLEDIKGSNKYNSDLSEEKINYLTKKLEKQNELLNAPIVFEDEFVYLSKYLKYKTKYLKLKNKLN